MRVRWLVNFVVLASLFCCADKPGWPKGTTIVNGRFAKERLLLRQSTIATDPSSICGVEECNKANLDILPRHAQLPVEMRKPRESSIHSHRFVSRPGLDYDYEYHCAERV